jgi:hypothetical protein
MIMAQANPDDCTQKAIAAIRQVKLVWSPKTRHYYLVLLFDEPEWMEYVHQELWFRFKGQMFQKFTDVPISPEDRGLLMELDTECQPQELRVFAEPAPDQAYIKFYCLPVVKDCH